MTVKVLHHKRTKQVTPTKLLDCRLCQESTHMNHACMVCALPPGGGGTFGSSVFNRFSGFQRRKKNS